MAENGPDLVVAGAGGGLVAALRGSAGLIYAPIGYRPASVRQPVEMITAVGDPEPGPVRMQKIAALRSHGTV